LLICSARAPSGKLHLRAEFFFFARFGVIWGETYGIVASQSIERNQA
jgi:hypothetical protein